MVTKPMLLLGNLKGQHGFHKCTLNNQKFTCEMGKFTAVPTVLLKDQCNEFDMDVQEEQTGY